MKIAVISTVWFPLSHTDVIVTRWVEPFFTDEKNGWVKPPSTINSVYLDQTTERDIGHSFCKENAIPIFATVREALTLGTDKLAVDAVLLIGEHGDYPLNEYRQRLYPRKRLFDEITAVFRESNRSVPIFNDKHFSWNFADSCEMLAVAEELGFPLYGGSSLTHCPLDADAPVRDGEGVNEVLALFHGDPDNYGYHSMEYVQSLIEKRSGGETGIRAVRSFEGQAVLAALAAGEIPRDLLVSALIHHGYDRVEETLDFLLSRTENHLVYQIEHRDGVRVTHFAMPKFASEWIAAVRTASGDIRTCGVVANGPKEFFGNFAYLNARIEQFFQTGVPPTPTLRTHIVSGALQFAMQGLKNDPGKWVETPQLGVTY